MIHAVLSLTGDYALLYSIQNVDLSYFVQIIVFLHFFSISFFKRTFEELNV